MLADLTGQSIATIKAAAKRLTGIRRREFQAQVTLDYCCGSPRRSEIVFGRGRETVCTGLGELRSGIECRGNFSARGRHRTEEVLPHLEEDCDYWLIRKAKSTRSFNPRSRTLG